MEQFFNLNPKNTVQKFSGKDNKKLFRNNKKELQNWVYHNKKIEYRYNEQGFRGDSFASIDWRNSVVVLGCSAIEGIGLAEEDTLVKQLENRLDRPVVNLGISSSGVDIACWNSTILNQHYPCPKAVVQIWSSLSRYADIKRKHIEFFFPRKPYYNYKLNWKSRSILYIKTDRQMWKDKTIYAEASFFPDTAKNMNIKKFDILDMARDLSHPGIESNRNAAEQLAQELQKQNL